MVMASVIVYSTMTCGYCVQARSLLDAKDVPYKVVYIDKEPAQFKKMLEITDGQGTVPQIVINGKLIGGFSDLKRLNDSGELDVLLKQGAKKP